MVILWLQNPGPSLGVRPPAATAACGHPRPRTGVGTLLALRIGGFVTGPIGPGTWQPSRSSTPRLGAWPCPRGASAPALPVHQGAQCVVVGFPFLKRARRHWSHFARMQSNLVSCCPFRDLLFGLADRHSNNPGDTFSTTPAQRSRKDGPRFCKSNQQPVLVKTMFSDIALMSSTLPGSPLGVLQ